MRRLILFSAPLLAAAACAISAGAAEAPTAPLLLASAAGPGAHPPPAPFVGNKGSRKVHRSDCEWGKKISPGKRKYFKTYQKAAAQGYVPCSICKPNLAAGLPDPSRPVVRDTDFVSSTRKSIFHRGGCDWVRKIGAEHLVIYRTREEAIADGKSPCRACNP